jgi:hypothetical protein
MADNQAPAVQWNQVRNEVLRERSAAVLGPATATTEIPTLTCTAQYTSAGDILVTVDGAATLADVHDLLVRISRACLNDDPVVTFARECSRPTAVHPTFRPGNENR